MMKEILYILLDNYAEHEIGFMPGAVSTDATGFRKEPKYINKMVAPTMEPVKSIGGMRTLPDYSFETMPADYAACQNKNTCKKVGTIWENCAEAKKNQGGE